MSKTNMHVIGKSACVLQRKSWANNIIYIERSRDSNTHDAVIGLIIGGRSAETAAGSNEYVIKNKFEMIL